LAKEKSGNKIKTKTIITWIVTLLAACIIAFGNFFKKSDPIPEPNELTGPEGPTIVRIDSTIAAIIKYKGKPISDAYFRIESYESSKSDNTGVIRCTLPLSILNSQKEFDFYVYEHDTLLYKKSMRFRNLDFNHF